MVNEPVSPPLHENLNLNESVSEQSRANEASEGVGSAGVEDMGEQEDEEAAGDSAEGRASKVSKGPREPTQAEREQHELTHIPPRLWCSHCRRGRFIASPHYRQDDPTGSRQYPIISLDYAYLGGSKGEDDERWAKAKGRQERGEPAIDDEYNPENLCVLVLHDSASKSIAVFYVDKKGGPLV